MVEKQELYCHECGMYVQFDIDLSLNGNHVLNCPNCGHEHCRVVKDGIITEDRWDSRNNVAFIPITISTFTRNSTYDTYTSTSTSSFSSVFLYSSWMNTATIV